MGCFDTVFVPCPQCGTKYAAQSKGGDCILAEYEMDEAPSDVMSNVNRHAPFVCDTCGCVFKVTEIKPRTIQYITERISRE